MNIDELDERLNNHLLRLGPQTKFVLEEKLLGPSETIDGMRRKWIRSHYRFLRTQRTYNFAFLLSSIFATLLIVNGLFLPAELGRGALPDDRLWIFIILASSLTLSVGAIFISGRQKNKQLQLFLQTNGKILEIVEELRQLDEE